MPQLRRVTWWHPMCVNHGWQHRPAVSVGGYSCTEEGQPSIRFLDAFWKREPPPRKLALKLQRPARTWSALVALSAASPLFCPGLSVASSPAAPGQHASTLHTASPPLTNVQLHSSHPPHPRALPHCCPLTCTQSLRFRPRRSTLAISLHARESNVKELDLTPHYPPQCPSRQTTPMR